HRIRCGDSLVGIWDPAVLKKGIPDGAYDPVAGDDKGIAKSLKRRNEQERAGQQVLFGEPLDDKLLESALEALDLDKIPDDSVEAIAEKQRRFNAIQHSLFAIRQAANLWTAAFFQELKPGSPGITTDAVRRALAGQPVHGQIAGLTEALAHRLRFFHWPLEFPEVFADGGFDCILGNPPHGGAISLAAKRLLAVLFPSATTAHNSAAYFIALASSILSVRGRAGLVVPKSFTFSHAWTRSRNALLPGLLSVVDVGRAWPVVLLEQVLITFAKPSTRHTSTITLGRLVDRVFVPSRLINQDLIAKLGIIPTGLSEDDYALLHAVHAQASSTLASICSTRRGTAIQRFLLQHGDIPALLGRDISEFERPVYSRFVNRRQIDPNLLRFTSPPQAVFQNIVAHVKQPHDHLRLIGTVIHERVACADTVNLIFIHHEAISPHVVCGLLMSDLINWFVYICVYNRAIRTMHFDGYVLSRIIIPEAKKLSALVEPALLLECDPRSQDAWEALNEAVYNAYAIPKSLRQYVTARHRPRWIQS
ncbi:MAG: hypothetical protein QXT77_09640, partial [Candidatus Methanomethylicaceae archaeon]